MADSNTRRIVLLGKTGSGKSSLANTLFGESDVFEVNHLPNSGTKHCMSKTRIVNGRSLQLIDTPGFFDTDPRSTELSPALLECIIQCAPGPHAFLLVLKMEKYTVLEQAVVDLMLRYFSEDALKYTTVVFTRGDDLPVGMKIEEWVKQNEDLKNLVQKCGSRCHVIDNKYWNNSQDPYRNNQFQIEQILKTIDQTVIENKGGYYTNELIKMVAKQIEKTNKPHVSNLLMNNMIGVAVGVILGAFLGGVGGVALAQHWLASNVVMCVAGGAGAAVLAAVGAGSGAVISQHIVKPLANAMKNTVKGLMKDFKSE